jgi:hypothetical protein
MWRWQRSLLRTAECLGTMGTGTTRQLVTVALQAKIGPAVLQITPATTCGPSFRRGRLNAASVCPCTFKPVCGQRNIKVGISYRYLSIMPHVE